MQASTEHFVHISINLSPTWSLACWRDVLYGEMRDTIDTIPFLESSLQRYATRWAWISLSFLEKPRSGDNDFLTSSPSSNSTFIPRSFNLSAMILAKVVLPDDGKPVNHNTNSFSDIPDIIFLQHSYRLHAIV